MTVALSTNEALALHGGTPVRSKLLPYGRQTVEEDDIQLVVETLRFDWLTTGPKVGEFEEAFATWVHRDVSHAWHLYSIRLDLPHFFTERDEIFRALRAENIGVNVHYIPVHLHPYYRERFGYRGGEFPVAESAYKGLITLPLFHGMPNCDVEDVVSATEKVIRHYLV